MPIVQPGHPYDFLTLFTSHTPLHLLKDHIIYLQCLNTPLTDDALECPTTTIQQNHNVSLCIPAPFCITASFKEKETYKDIKRPKTYKKTKLLWVHLGCSTLLFYKLSNQAFINYTSLSQGLNFNAITL